MCQSPSPQYFFKSISQAQPHLTNASEIIAFWQVSRILAAGYQRVAPKISIPTVGERGRAQLGHMLLSSRQHTCSATFAKVSQRIWGRLGLPWHASADVVVGCWSSNATERGCQWEGSQQLLGWGSTGCGVEGGLGGRETRHVKPSMSEGIVVSKDVGKGKLTDEQTLQASAHICSKQGSFPEKVWSVSQKMDKLGVDGRRPTLNRRGDPQQYNFSSPRVGNGCPLY